MTKSAAVRIALMLALVAALFVNFGSRNASAQQPATASATPTPYQTPRSVEVPILVHGTGPRDGDQYLLRDSVGKPVTRTFEIEPLTWVGPGAPNVLTMHENEGIFTTPERLGGYRIINGATGQREYDPRVVELNGHGNSVLIRTKRCQKLAVWDFNFFVNLNQVYTTYPNDIQVVAFFKKSDGTEEEVPVAKLLTRGSGAVEINSVHRYAQMYAGDRGASQLVYPGQTLNTFKLPIVPTTEPWLMTTGLLGVSFSMDMQSPFMMCVGLGVRINHWSGYGTTQVGILDVVETRKGGSQVGQGLYYGVVNGIYPTGTVCGDEADTCALPPVCETTIEFTHPSQLKICNSCAFPVRINPLAPPVPSNSQPARITLSRWDGYNLTQRINAFYTAYFYSLEAADCNNMRWIAIRRGALDCYGVQLDDDQKRLLSDVHTIGDLHDAAAQAILTPNVISTQRAEAILVALTQVAPRRVF